MIDNDKDKPCRTVFCYRGKTAQTAKEIFHALEKSDKLYGRVWYSDLESIGNFKQDISILMKNANFVILFLCEGFTDGFLNDDGTTNFSADSSRSDGQECITAGEIIEIERQRNLREDKDFKIIAIHNNDESLNENELKVLKKVFENEGFPNPDKSVEFYKLLHRNPYYCRKENPDDFVKQCFKNIEINEPEINYDGLWVLTGEFTKFQGENDSFTSVGRLLLQRSTTGYKVLYCYGVSREYTDQNCVTAICDGSATVEQTEDKNESLHLTCDIIARTSDANLQGNKHFKMTLKPQNVNVMTADFITKKTKGKIVFTRNN